MKELTKQNLDLIMVRPCQCNVDATSGNDDEVSGLIYVEDGKVIFQPACEEEKIILKVRDHHWRSRDDGSGKNEEFYMVSKDYKIPFTNLTYCFSLWLEYEYDKGYNIVGLNIV